MNPFLQFLLALLGSRQGGMTDLTGVDPRSQRTRIQPVPGTLAPAPPNVPISQRVPVSVPGPLLDPQLLERIQRDPLKALPPRDLTRPDPLKPPGVFPEAAPGSVIGPGGLPLDPQVFSGFKPEERDPLRTSKPEGVLREPLRPGGFPSDLDLSPAVGFERQGGLIRSTDPDRSTNRARPGEFQQEEFQLPEEPEPFQEDRALLDLIESFRRPRDGFNPFATPLITRGLNFGFGRNRRRNEFLL